MKYKEKNGQITADILILYGLLLLLSFICRLWPVILFAILGLFVVMLHMLIVSLSNKISGNDEPEITETNEHRKIYTKGGLEMAVFQDFEDQITEFVLSRFMDASWCWEIPDAKKRIFLGENVYIRLDHAGGYKWARVIYQGLKVYGLNYGNGKMITDDEPPEEIVTEKPPVVNYSMIAFEWCEAHMADITDRLNKAVSEGQNEIMLSIEELPVPESFEDICKEIVRQKNKETKIMTDGILIML